MCSTKLPKVRRRTGPPWWAGWTERAARWAIGSPSPAGTGGRGAAGGKKNILDSNNALANAVKFTSRYEQSSAKETFIFDVESAKIRKITDTKNTIPQDDNTENESPEIMEVEIEPFQAIFNHQFIVFYRHIWRNNEPFIQGFVVNLATYLGSLIRNDVVFNLQDQTTTIEFGSKSRPFVIFGKIDKQKSSILSMPLQAPLGDMFFTMYLTPDEKFNAESMVVLLGFLMFAVLAGGLIAIYRLTESQLTLANKKQDLISADERWRLPWTRGSPRPGAGGWTGPRRRGSRRGWVFPAAPSGL